MEASAASGASELADASAAYALGYSPAERDRLRRQPDQLRDDSEVLLDRVGIAEGSSVIDLGCGPQGILDLLAEMVRLARPGGCVAVLEPDVGVSVCYPPHPAWDRMAQIFRDVTKACGMDVHISRRLAELFRQAGLAGIEIEARRESTRPAIRAVPSGPTCCEARTPRSRRKESPMSANWTRWTGRWVSISMTQARW